MKKIVAILILSYGLLNPIQAQDYYRAPVSHQPRTNYKDTFRTTSYFFSFGLGISIPQRDYASKSTSNNFMIVGPDSTNGKGFANVGFHADVNVGFFLSQNFGLMAKIAYNQNSFDESILNTLVNGGYYYTVTSNYNIWQFMGGVFDNIPINKNSSLWLQGTIGLINADFPPFTISIGQLAINGSLANANNFAYCLGLGYEKEISQNVGFTVMLTYTGAGLSYPNFTFSYAGNFYNLPPPYIQHTPVTMPYGSLDLSLGFMFHL